MEPVVSNSAVRKLVTEGFITQFLVCLLEEIKAEIFRGNEVITAASDKCFSSGPPKIAICLAMGAIQSIVGENFSLEYFFKEHLQNSKKQ